MKISLASTLVFLSGLWKLFDIAGWQKWIGASVLGFVFVLPSNNNLSVWQLQGFAIGISLVLSYNQAINDCFDVEIDKMKRDLTGKKLVVSHIIPRRIALAMTASILFLGLASLLLASRTLFLVGLLMALLGTAYSAPPLRLKQKYPFSTLTQYVGCFLPFLAGVTVTSRVTYQTLLVSSLFALLAMTHRFEHEIENYRVDLLTAKRTVAVVHGVVAATRLARLCLIVGLAEFLLFLYMGWFSIAFLVMFALYLFICVIHAKWIRYLPRCLRVILIPVLMVGGFALLFVTLLLNKTILV